MKLLTQAQGVQLVKKAWIMVIKHQESKYRMGQALFNLLPDELYKHFTGTDYDFFYKPHNEALELFYEHYVEK